MDRGARSRRPFVVYMVGSALGGQGSQSDFVLFLFLFFFFTYNVRSSVR